MTYDLIVVGGGPAGSAAAITAARNGASVLMLERGRFPRHKVCGEFVSAESLELLGNLFDAGHQSLIREMPRISQGRVFADGVELPLGIDPAGASISRFDLDFALYQSCVTSRVEVRLGCAVRKVTGGDLFSVECGEQQFRSRAVVNAAGRWSALTSTGTRAHLKKARWIGVKAQFDESTPPASVDLYFFPGGYCGAQPVTLAANGSSARINACAMVRADIATGLERVLDLHPALRERSRTWASVIDPVTTSPLVFHPPEPVQNDVLQVGDAATFVDPFIGDGISLALRSGALAANCLGPFFRGECSLAQSADNYSLLYRQRLAGVFRASSLIRRMLRTPRFVRRPVLSLLQRTPYVTRRIVQLTR
jgi:flavin-dependent dehydrogenase